MSTTYIPINLRFNNELVSADFILQHIKKQLQFITSSSGKISDNSVAIVHEAKESIKSMIPPNINHWLVVFILQ